MNQRFTPNGTARKELGELLDSAAKAAKVRANGQRRRPIEAHYDAAQNSDGLLNFWAATDHFDADSAHSPDVRQKLRARSRYEIGNNGYSDGIAQTYANDLVGIGPALRMQTASEGFNRMVETEWYRWCKAVKFARKLWCQAHAKHQDGEGFGICKRNPKVRHPVKLDYVLVEAEQVSTPSLPYGEAGYIDGIKFDEFANPTWYDVLKEHPGGQATIGMESERVDAQYVMHWFKLRRPGQHRGIPECSSTLNVGAAGRRWREATLSTAEKIARFTLFLETTYPPETAEAVDPMSVLDIQDGMMTTLPDGMKPHQLDVKHPAAAHDAFHKTLISEQGRSRNMPRNKAMCDSSDYNYASGRLDHQTYYGSLDVDREDGNDSVLDPLFDIWFTHAVLTYGWLGGDPEALSLGARAHAWDWPKHFVADIQAEASANTENLRSGSLSLARLYSQNGEDFEDELIVMASNYGVTPDEMRAILRTAIFNAQNQQASMLTAATQSAVAQAAETPSAETSQANGAWVWLRKLFGWQKPEGAVHATAV